jgi:hypothetical protein
LLLGGPADIANLDDVEEAWTFTQVLDTCMCYGIWKKGCEPFIWSLFSSPLSYVTPALYFCMHFVLKTFHKSSTVRFLNTDCLNKHLM